MKKTLLKLLSVAMAFAVAFTGMVIPQTQDSHADFLGVEKNYSKNIKVQRISKEDYEELLLYMGKDFPSSGKVKVTVSNKSVLKYSSHSGSLLWFSYKKPGTTNVTIKVTKSGKTKTYKTKITVYNYENPFKVFKVAGSNRKKRFNKEYYSNTVKIKSKSTKVKITPKKGWELKSIKCNNKKIKNNSKIKLKKEEYSSYYGADLEVRMKNKKSKQTTTFYMYVECRN